MKHIWILFAIVFVGCAMPTLPVIEVDLSQVPCLDQRFNGTYSLNHTTGISTFVFDGSCRATFKYFNKSSMASWYDYRYIFVSGSKVTLEPSYDTSTYIAEFGEYKDAEYGFSADRKYLTIKNSSKTLLFTRSE